MGKDAVTSKPRETELCKVKESSGRAGPPSLCPGNLQTQCNAHGLMQWQHHITELQGLGLHCGPPSSHPHMPWGQQHWHWNGGHMSLQHLRGEVELRVEDIVFIPIWGEIPGVSGSPRPSLPRTKGWRRGCCLLFPSCFITPKTTHTTPHETLADRKSSGAGGSTALRGIFPPSQGLHFQLN